MRSVESRGERRGPPAPGAEEEDRIVTDGMKDKAKGTVDELKGRGKSALGDLTGDRQMEAEGKGDQLKGKVERGIGDLKDKAEEVKDNIGDAMNRNANDYQR
jgi:uncharacterized protein YjbJ (UPF0337 family)